MEILFTKGCDCMFYKDNDVPEPSLKNTIMSRRNKIWKKKLKS